MRASLRATLETALEQHRRDLREGVGWVELPSALAIEYPNASRSAPRQWVSPATRTYRNAQTGQVRRRHLQETVIQRAVRQPVSRAGILKRATGHTLRHSFATHLFADGQDIRTIQELLGPKSVSTMMISTHVLNRGPLGVCSPAGRPGPR